MFEKTWFYCFMQILIHYSTICTANPIEGKSYVVKKGEYPFFVSLSFSSNINDKESYFCAGALISKRLVLTAEHCLRDLNKNNVMVILNPVESNSAQVRGIKSWMSYEEWALSKLSPEDLQTRPDKYYEMMGTRDFDNNNTLVVSQNDIAIIVLSKKVVNIEPAKLTALHDYELIGAEAVTVGWGSVSDSVSKTLDTLLQANVKVLNSSEVQQNLYKLFNVNPYVDPHFLYTIADPPAVLSDGDSGGPLMLRSSKKLIGVNKGKSNVEGNQISPYAMIRHAKLLDKYRKFIKDMENNSKN